MNASSNLDTMAEMNELDDLGDLFEFGDIDLNTIPDSVQYGDQIQSQHGTHPNTPFQDMTEPPPMPGTAAHDFGGHAQYGLAQGMERQPYVRPHDARAPTSVPFTTEALYQPSIQPSYNSYSQGFHFQAQPGFPSHHHVPPTPNSYEMHGETGNFMQQQQQQHQSMDPQQRAILEQRYNVRKDDAIAFTPMVSPAGTPQFNVLPEYTTPGAYFSPLTSPMLHGQSQQHAQLQPPPQQRAYLTHPNTAPSSNTNSPTDIGLDIDMLDGVSLPDSTGPKPRKSKRRAAPPRTATGSNSVKQSPAQSAQKRKSAPPPADAPFEDVALTSQSASAGLQIPPQFDSSEAESISPEPLSESVMGPPPRPGSSLAQSPALLAQHQQTNGSVVMGAAATPKSLLTMRGGQQQFQGQQTPTQSSNRGSSDSLGLDDLSLPEAARSQSRQKPSLSQINTHPVLPTADENTPRLSARKTPKLGPLSTPSSARPGSAVGSPSLAGSPMTVGTPSAVFKDKKDARGGRNSKKRGSVSGSVTKLVSPALVPKISPSIKPLLPEGSKCIIHFGIRALNSFVAAPLNTATQAMLLASKSNYQNLLEGNHLPGVTYPDSLSTGLTSKRTSHKVAEQGRRNRINEALKEMQSLIPKPVSSLSKSPSKDAGDADAEVSGGAGENDDLQDGANGKDDTSAKSNNSKAATVELANDYIKKMQKDNAAQNAEMAQLKRENDLLRKRLAEQSGGSSSSAHSPASASQAEVEA